MRLEVGWCWTLHRAEHSEAALFDQMDDVCPSTVHVIPSEFFSVYGVSTRGFLGRVERPGHLFHDSPVLAFTMADGFEHDFTSHVSHTCGFFFGAGELVCPPDSFPRLRGPHIVAGYGHVTDSPMRLTLREAV
jgi:hypothetical protein